MIVDLNCRQNGTLSRNDMILSVKLVSPFPLTNIACRPTTNMTASSVFFAESTVVLD